MASNYEGFDVSIEDDAGRLTNVPDATVEVYDATNVEALDPLTADSDGHVDAGSLDVDAGTTIRFRVESHLGLAGVLEQVTT